MVGTLPGPSGARNLGEKIQYAQLLLAWTRREFRIRYTQTLLGSVWSIVQPLGLTLAFTFLFRGLTKIDVGVPYVLYAYLGASLWTMLSGGITMATSVLTNSLPIAGKVSYPRSVAPLAGSLLAVVDLLIAVAIFPVLVLSLGHSMSFRPIMLLASVGGCLVLSIGLGLMVSALTVFVRDLKNALPFIFQIGVLISPIGYPASQLPDGIRTISEWNPITTYVVAFRSSLLDLAGPTAMDWLRSLVITAVVCIAGMGYFARVESRFTDVA